MVKDLVMPTASELTKTLPDTKVSEITKIARRQYKLEAEIAEDVATLSEKNKRLQRIKTVELPEAMAAAGVKKLTLTGGYDVTVDDFISASIAEEDEAEAFKWLRANKLGSLIKHVFKCSFGMGEEKKAKALKTLLNKNKFIYEQSEGVHSQTLRALVRERLTAGLALPESIKYTSVPTSAVKPTRKK